MRAFWRTAWIVVRKDLTIELRTREILAMTIFFAFACILMFAVAFVKDGRPLLDAAAGIMWIAVFFAGTLALGRTFERERHGDTVRALLLAPTQRPAIYVGKLLGILALLGVTELLIVPLIALLFQTPLFDHALLLVALLATGTIGFCAVGTLFAAMLVRTRGRDVWLPILLYPITIPVIIAGVRGTVALIGPEADIAMARFWVLVLFFFDVVFVTLSLWTFEPLMTD
jgi:heme exporter protein B